MKGCRRGNLLLMWRFRKSGFHHSGLPRQEFYSQENIYLPQANMIYYQAPALNYNAWQSLV